VNSIHELKDEKKKTRRSTDDQTTLDDFLKEEGKLGEFEAVATIATLQRAAKIVGRTLRIELL
jgi:hypothetical protein